MDLKQPISTIQISHVHHAGGVISREAKIAQIEQCLSQKEVNLWQLREHCLTPGGLITSELRRRSWHKLVGIDLDDLNRSAQEQNPSKMATVTINEDPDCVATADTCTTPSPESGDIPSNKLEKSLSNDKELISRDVGRAVYFRYPITEATRGRNSGDEKGEYIESGQSMLTKIILSTISSKVSPTQHEGRLNYYQGFHDVASVVFVNMSREPQLASAILGRIAQSHLRDAMKEDFSDVSALLEIVFYPLLQRIDEKLHDYLILRELGPTVFLTWMITLFSHDIHDSEIASRFFDAIIASHPLMPLYLTLAILTHPLNRQQLFSTSSSEAAMLQVVATGLLSNIDSDFISTLDGFTCQEMIDNALAYMKRVPPESLLTLSKKYDLGQSEILMERCKSLILFEPPKAWALSNNYMHYKDRINEKSRGKGEITLSISAPKEFPNARIATGVTSIMYNENEKPYNGFGESIVKLFGYFAQTCTARSTTMCQ